MIHDPPAPAVRYISVLHPPCIPWLSLHRLTLDRVSTHKAGLLFNEPGPQGEENNYLLKYQSEESLPPPHLFHVVCCGGRTVAVSCLFFGRCFALSLAPCLHGRGDKWWVTQRAGGRHHGPIICLSSSHFLASSSLSAPFVSNLSSYLLSVFVFACKSLTFLFFSTYVPLPFHRSLSLMNISHRNAIYSLFLCSIHQAQISHLWVLSD